MILSKHWIVCDECMINELSLKAKLIENAYKEAMESNWKNQDISKSTLVCPDCQEKKGGK